MLFADRLKTFVSGIVKEATDKVSKDILEDVSGLKEKLAIGISSLSNEIGDKYGSVCAKIKEEVSSLDSKIDNRYSFLESKVSDISKEIDVLRQSQNEVQYDKIATPEELAEIKNKMVDEVSSLADRMSGVEKVIVETVSANMEKLVEKMMKVRPVENGTVKALDKREILLNIREEKIKQAEAGMRNMIEILDEKQRIEDEMNKIIRENDTLKQEQKYQLHYYNAQIKLIEWLKKD